jgi:plasmid stabilization system protein ParE
VVDRVRQVEWTASASASLDEVVAYINKTSAQNARLVLSDALSAAASLSHLAERGRLVPEQPHPPTRELFVRGFRLMYQLTETHVTIVAFVRGRRSFPLSEDDGDAV